MEILDILVSLAIGALAGWLAGMIMGSKNSLLLNIILGIVGGFVGGLIFSFLGIEAIGIFGTIICAVVGACLVIFIVRLIKK